MFKIKNLVAVIFKLIYQFKKNGPRAQKNKWKKN